MTSVSLEDFGDFSRPQAPIAAPSPDTDLDYDAAYNAGWDDAMTQVGEEQGRIGEKLAERLVEIERDQQRAIASAVSALEPMLHEIFDKLLPRAAERAFLPILIDEIREMLSDGAGKLLLLVAPEEAQPLGNLLDRAGLTPDQVTVRAESALSLSQALVRWDDQERRIDLGATLSAMDDALESFLASIESETADG
ncbi:MAG: hypothetical protein WBA25_00660 [Jannaschia sp.]